MLFILWRLIYCPYRHHCCWCCCSLSTSMLFSLKQPLLKFAKINNHNNIQWHRVFQSIQLTEWRILCLMIIIMLSLCLRPATLHFKDMLASIILVWKWNFKMRNYDIIWFVIIWFSIFVPPKKNAPTKTKVVLFKDFFISLKKICFFAIFVCILIINCIFIFVYFRKII